MYRFVKVHWFIHLYQHDRLPLAFIVRICRSLKLITVDIAAYKYMKKGRPYKPYTTNFTCNLRTPDRSIMHPKFNPTRVPTHNSQIRDSAFHVPEMPVLTTEPSQTSSTTT